MLSIPEFILSKPSPQREILDYFHHLFTQHLGLTCKMRYGIPFYDRNTWLCYLNPLKTNGIELVFINGRELSNRQGLLNDKGRKMVSGIEFYALEEVPEEVILEIVEEALILDDIKRG